MGKLGYSRSHDVWFLFFQRRNVMMQLRLALNSQSFCLSQQSHSWIIGVNHHLFSSCGESICAHVCAYVGTREQLEGVGFFPLLIFEFWGLRAGHQVDSMYLQLMGHFCVGKILQRRPYFPALGKARCCVIKTLVTLGGPHRQAPTCTGASFGGGPSISEIVFSVCTL